MASISITKTYDNGSVLTETDLDNIKDSVETFLNTTKISGDNIQTGGVPTASIADLAVTAAKLAADAVTTAKILDSNVTTAKIADSNVTPVKRSACSTWAGSATNTYTITGSAADVTGATVTVTAAAKPILVRLQSDGSGNAGYFSITTNCNGYVELFRDSTAIARWGIGHTAGGGVYFPLELVSFMDTSPGSGSVVYKLKAQDSNATSSTVNYFKLTAVELS